MAYLNASRQDALIVAGDLTSSSSTAALITREPESHSAISVENLSISDTLDVDEKTYEPLPKKKLPHPLRGIRLRVLIIYRCLFSLVWLTNIVALMCILAIPSIGRQWISIIAFINLTTAVLIRQDFIVNAIYTVCCSAPKWYPLAIRLRLAKVYHFGGLHSGAATAAVCWLTGTFGYNIKCHVGTCSLPSKPSIATLVTTALILLLLFSMIIFAWPPFRKRHHNIFERVHRLSGWSAVALIWAQVILTARDAQLATPGRQSLGHAVVQSPQFWMLVAVTISIATSWLNLRQVSVDTEVLSDHAVRLHFNYAVPVNGSFARISERPLLEWHSFATIAAPTADNDHPRGYSMVVSRAGDWTSRQIDHPPMKLWTRGVPSK